MSGVGKQPLFVDTGAFYARIDEDDENHERAVEMFNRIRSGTVGFEPVYTSQAVLSELATLALYRLSHEQAVSVLDAVDSSATFNVLDASRVEFATAREQFRQYDDQEISFADHLTGVFADRYGVDYVFGFDSDFETLGLSLIPG